MILVGLFLFIKVNLLDHASLPRKPSKLTTQAEQATMQAELADE